ncbi:MAG TPA: branched-chain amino acid ABC transporter substrate-binding protein [Candidatus Tumulicola sp.]|nr:branched-chain amino acid ABC transporter substrate-binding protein [Candidatus Tumulicola sp.]
MSTFRPAAALAALALCWGLGGCSGGSSSPGNTIKIGIDLPLSGADASVGRSTLNGMLLAIDQASKRGLPGGFALQAEQLDDAVQGVHSPQQGVANVRTFVSDPSVLAVLGPYNSNVAAAQIPITNEAGLAQISPSTVSDGLTIGPDAAALRRSNPTQNAFFRVCTTDARQGAAAAAFAMKLGLRSAYIIDDNETYGLDLANVFERDYRKLGGTVLGHDHIAKNTQDFKALLTKIAGTKPQLVFYGGTTSTGAGLIRQQMFDTGLGTVPFMGGDGIPDLATVAGARADGTYYTVAAPNAEKLPSARAFIKAYQAAYREPVGPYSANAYAAAQVAIAAIARAIVENGNKMPTRAQVLAAVASTHDLATPIGNIGFDAKGDVTEPVLSLYAIKGGKSVFIDQINLKAE